MLLATRCGYTEQRWLHSYDSRAANTVCPGPQSHGQVVRSDPSRQQGWPDNSAPRTACGLLARVWGLQAAAGQQESLCPCCCPQGSSPALASTSESRAQPIPGPWQWLFPPAVAHSSVSVTSRPPPPHQGWLPASTPGPALGSQALDLFSFPCYIQHLAQRPKVDAQILVQRAS